MSKLTINKITRYTTDKDNKPLINAQGKPYTRVYLETVEYPNVKLSGFDSKETSFLKEGSTLDAEVSQSGQYWNFKVLKKEDLLADRVAALEERVSKLEGGSAIQF